MSNRQTKLFPAQRGNLRSRSFTIPCGQAAKISGYGLCPGVCIKVNEVHEDPCRCEYNEKPVCYYGAQVGIDEKCTTAILPMPGKYVLYLCLEEGVELDDDFCVYADIGDQIDNVQTVLMAANGVKE